MATGGQRTCSALDTTRTYNGMISPLGERNQRNTTAQKDVTSLTLEEAGDSNQCNTLIPFSLTLGIFSYNHASLIPEVIQSISSASVSPHTVYFFDDSSEDGTPDVIRDCSRTLTNLQWNVGYQFRPENVGFPVQLNAFIDLVKTEWFMIMSADDVFLPWSIDLLAHAARVHPHADVIFGNFRSVDESGNTIPKSNRQQALWATALRECSVPTLAQELLLREGSFVPGGFTLVRKKLPPLETPRFREDLPNAEDYAWYLEAAATHRFLAVDSEIAAVSVLSTSKSRTAGSKMTLSLLAIMRTYLESHHPMLSRAARRAATRIWLASFFRRKSSGRVGVKHLLQLPTVSPATVVVDSLTIATKELSQRLRLPSQRVPSQSRGNPRNRIAATCFDPSV